MTREWSAVVAAQPRRRATAGRLVDGVVATVRALREDELFVRIVELDPELLLPYLLARRGRSQDLVLDLLVDRIEQGQAAGEIRAGDPLPMARGAGARRPRVRAQRADHGRRRRCPRPTSTPSSPRC